MAGPRECPILSLIRMIYRRPQLLIEEISKRNLVTPEVLAEVEKEAQENGREFGEVLIEKGTISDQDLTNLKSEVYRIPTANINDIEIDGELSKKISDTVVNFYKIIPLREENDILKVALIDPENNDALQALKIIASGQDFQYEKYLVTYKDFNDLYRNYRSLSSEVGQVLESIGDELAAKDLKISEKEDRLEDITADSPVTRVVSAIIKHAVEAKASDVHLEPSHTKLRLRLRIDGDLKNILTLSGSLHAALVTRIKILSDLKIDETRLAQDGRFATTIGGRTIDFRVSTFPTVNGEKVVLRVLDPLAGQIELEQLGLEGRSLRLVLESIVKPYGALLITGPTGSGKSTTLAAVLRKMNSEDVNIVTLEDPVEYYVSGVNQSQIHEEIGYNFANGLRHILRQDPDIIMVGEIRDKETAGLATQAALTGHIVLSTLHTNDAIGVVPRLIDMGVERYLIPPTLNVAAAQRLLRRLCPDCKIKVKANSGEEKIINDAIENMPPEYKKQLYSEKGYEIYKPNTENPCRACGGKAYKGRIGIFETMEMTDEFEKIILGTLSEAAMREEAKRQGMITMFQDGILKVLKGVVSLEELLEVAQANESA